MKRFIITKILIKKQVPNNKKKLTMKKGIMGLILIFIISLRMLSLYKNHNAISQNSLNKLQLSS